MFKDFIGESCHAQVFKLEASGSMGNSGPKGEKKNLWGKNWHGPKKAMDYEAMTKKFSENLYTSLKNLKSTNEHYLKSSRAYIETLDFKVNFC